ncbi:MAG: biotin/lipoyl-containing protein [Roseicyclus sp.]|uniref:biotin/lipoyl-containing protein n=1 Tax=Roseicyclus sp. TaxID=1914329 RepID=UPI003A873DD8
MPRDVTMPQLGMAQDAGKIVSWLKSPGEAVTKGDALFEVETDKAVMEVESPADGYLTGVAYPEGADVPVGQVIARITDSPEETGTDDTGDPQAPDATTTDRPAAGDSLPEGHKITMPQLGMAQDTGLLVSWLKAPGDEVAPEDILFEVETDKSTMEVEAGRKGWLAATLAQPGEEVPVGAPVAILSDTRPVAPLARALKDSAPQPAAKAEPKPEPAKADTPKPAPAKQAPAAPKPAPATAPMSGDRILASPKARRLAREQGLDLARLVEAGHPQPFHVADLDTLRALPPVAQTATGAATGIPAASPRRLTALCPEDGLTGFVAWAARDLSLSDADAILAGLVGASLGQPEPVTIAIDRFGTTRHFTVPPGRALGSVTETGSDAPPALRLRDLRATRVASVAMGAEDAPVLTLAPDGTGLSITLECAADQLSAEAALALLTEFAGRMEQPLRHLL